MNWLQRDLRGARAEDSSITEIANRWGFQELGRTAAYYKELFGEPPSVTLERDPRRSCMQLVDALVDPTAAGIVDSSA